jgi:HK97 family phage portal protein
LPDDNLWEVLCERPNHWQTPFEFFEAMTILAVICGNSYAFVNSPTGTVRELIPLMNDQVEVIVNARHEVTYRVAVSGGEPLLLRQEQVFHLKGPGLGGTLGLDVLNTVREVIGLSQSMEEVHAEAMRRRGRTDGIVAADGDLDQDTVNRIHANFVDRFGPGKEGGVAFLDRGAKYHAMTQSMKDMEMVEHRRHAVDEVGRAFGVYSQLLNQHSANSAYASVEQVFLAHLTNTVEPWLVRLEQAVKRDVIGRVGVQNKKRLYCVRDSLVPGTIKDKADYLNSLMLMGILTPNEARVMIGRNPLDENGADRPMTQLNMRIGYEPAEVEQPVVKPAVEVQPVEQ